MATDTKKSHRPNQDDNPAKDEFDKLIERNISHGDERAMEERALDGAADDIKKATRSKAEGLLPGSAEHKEASLLGLPEDSGSFYKKSSAGKMFAIWGDRKKLLFGVGGAGVLLIAGMVAFFGFLNVFKLDHIMSNIDARSFARLNGGLDNRSTKYVQAYMRLRLADIGNNPDLDRPNDPDNLILRANRVDANNPLTDWYKTLRASKFEADLLEKNGIKFASVARREGSKIVQRPALVTIKDRSFTFEITDAELAAIERGDVNEFNGKLREFVEVKVFDNDKQGRKEIKKAVNENTHWSQVFKRRHVRKSIQNMTGVRDWRFFEDKRNKFDEKKIDVRNKIIAKTVPETIIAGKFIRCLAGISDCDFSRDPADPSNKAEGVTRGEVPKDGKTANDDGENKGKDRTTVNLGPANDVFQQLLRKIALSFGPLNAINFFATMDALVNIDEAIKTGQISKGVTVARGVQAMGMYQTFGTARDQIKPGEANSAEINEFMKLIGPITASEGWLEVIENQGDTKTVNTTVKSKAYCSTKHQAELEKDIKQANKEFAHLCPDKQIGSATRAGQLEKSYNESIGDIVGEVLAAYNGVRNAPLIGKLVDSLLSVFNAVLSVFAGVFEGALAALGLDDDINKAMQWLFGKVLAFLGAGPILNGTEPGGVMANWLIQGGAYTAEATARTNGASLTTPETAMLAESNLDRAQAEKNLQMSVFERYFALSNPESTASGGTFAASQLKMSSVTAIFTDFGKTFGTVFAKLSSPFGGRSSAQEISGYRAAEFADIQTYDFPSRCYSLDPINATPQSGTNIQQILSDKNIPDTDLTWELVTHSDRWYEYIYEKIGDKVKNADEIAEKVYNCHLLDTSVRGSLGLLYGYTNDNGLEDSGATSQLPDIENPAIPGPGGAASGDAKRLAEEILNNPNIDLSATNFCRYCTEDIRNTSEGRPAYGNVTIDINILKFLAELGQTGRVDVNAITGAGTGHSPNSNHYTGKALDFGCSLNVFTANSVGRKYGITRYTEENCPEDGHWHYSTTGN